MSHQGPVSKCDTVELQAHFSAIHILVLKRSITVLCCGALRGRKRWIGWWCSAIGGRAQARGGGGGGAKMLGFGCEMKCNIMNSVWNKMGLFGFVGLAHCLCFLGKRLIRYKENYQDLHYISTRQILHTSGGASAQELGKKKEKSHKYIHQ